MPGKKTLDYDLAPFQKLLQRLLEESGENYRVAALAAGLHPSTLSKYMSGARPMRDACIALAEHFGINPNEMLRAAGYEPLPFFDRRIIDPTALPPEVEQLVDEILEVEDEAIRQEMVDALRQILRIQMRMRQKRAGGHSRRRLAKSPAIQAFGQ